MSKNVNIKWNGDRIKRDQRESAARGLTKATEHVLQVSRTKVPIEEGTLERSGVAVVDTENLRGAISYDTPYAVRQHEDMGLRHADGRQAKYLEGPLQQESGTVQQIIAAEIRRGIS